MSILNPSFRLSQSPKQETKASPQTRRSLKDINLEVELLEQYKRALLLMETLGENTPANQQAQVLNSCTSIIQQIIKTQSDLYNVETIKVMEATLLNTLRKFPEMQDDFMSAYSKALENA